MCVIGWLRLLMHLGPTECTEFWSPSVGSSPKKTSRDFDDLKAFLVYSKFRQSRLYAWWNWSWLHQSFPDPSGLEMYGSECCCTCRIHVLFQAPGACFFITKTSSITSGSNAASLDLAKNTSSWLRLRVVQGFLDCHSIPVESEP